MISTLQGMLRKSKQRTHFRRKVYLNGAKDVRIRFLLFATVIILHSLAMVVFEELNWWQAFWLTMTSASTTGYGDISAASFLGQLATIVLIYGVGITLLAQIASDYIELRIQKKEMSIKGQLEWNTMQNHLLIINTPKHYTSSYLERLIKQICLVPDLQQIPIQILTQHFPEGLPTTLRDYGAVHQTGEATTAGCLERSHAEAAKYIVILSPDSQDAHSDSLVFDILHRLQAMQTKAYILAEAVDDANRVRFKEAGANSVIRPVRAYPEIVVRSLIAPGAEQLLEDLFTHQGDHPIRVDVEIDGLTWAQIVTKLINADLGTALGYEDRKGEIITHPSAKELISTQSLILLVDAERKINMEEIKGLFS